MLAKIALVSLGNPEARTFRTAAATVTDSAGPARGTAAERLLNATLWGRPGLRDPFVNVRFLSVRSIRSSSNV